MSTILTIVIIIFFLVIIKCALDEKKILNINKRKGLIDIKTLKRKYEKEIQEKYEKKLNSLKIDITMLKLENIKLKAKLNKQKENYKEYIKNREESIKKGKEYEYYILMHYNNNGYKVFPNGYVFGKNDKGIDLIAYKENEVILIQCKCYKKPPKQHLIRKFIGDCELYIKDYDTLKQRTIYKDFVTSCEEMDYGVEKFLEEYPNEVRYKIIV